MMKQKNRFIVICFTDFEEKRKDGFIRTLGLWRFCFHIGKPSSAQASVGMPFTG